MGYHIWYVTDAPFSPIIEETGLTASAVARLFTCDKVRVLRVAALLP